MKARVTVLGCGNSTGVPVAGGHWGECDPQEPKNRRRRCSIAVQTDEAAIIVDTGADFRSQVNDAGIKRLDAVLYTHAHSDHVAGADDLRPYRFIQKELIPVYSNAHTLSEIDKRMPYLFNGGDIDLYPPILEPHEITDYGRPMDIAGIPVVPFVQDHGTIESVGYRFGDFAYSVDIWKLDQAALDCLKGVKTWIVDAAAYHYKDNQVHAHIDRIAEYQDYIGAELVYITSLTLGMDYQILCAELPEPLFPVYDGLEFDIILS